MNEKKKQTKLTASCCNHIIQNEFELWFCLKNKNIFYDKRNECKKKEN